MTTTANKADLILCNADVRTMDQRCPRVGAVAIGGGRILLAGDDDRVTSLAGPATRVIDLGGRLVLPGFQDTHMHLLGSATEILYNADLYGARTPQELQSAVRDFADAHPDRPWVRGVGFNSSVFTQDTLTRGLLDEAVADRPVFLIASDYHNGAANTLGFERAGVGADTPDPANGRFVREADGRPAGFIVEEAIDTMIEGMPKYTGEQYLEGARFGAAHCNAHGITGVIDAMVFERDMRIYRELEEKGQLTVRVRGSSKVVPEEGVADAVARLKALRETYHSDRLGLHSAKFFIDGVFENRTAVLLEDYGDGGNAKPIFTSEQLVRYFTAFDREHFQIHAHTIGDGAVRMALDAYQAARETNGAWPSLHQTAHLQLVDPADIPRFAELGVVANFQPLWAQPEHSITDMVEPWIGPRRSEWIYPLGAAIDAGAPYAISSDWGVSTLDPFEIMQVAMTRQVPEDGPDGPVLTPRHRVGIDTLVRGYTVNAAACAWRSESTGSLTPGKYGDLIVVDRDIFAVPPHEVGETRVLLTLLEGAEVHRDPAFDA